MNKKIIKTIFSFLWILILLTLTSCTNKTTYNENTSSTKTSTSITLSNNTNTMSNSWIIVSDLTFKLSDKVNIEKVTFKNRYWIELAGFLFTPKNTWTWKLQAIAISWPFWGVKEQSSWLYANQMAEKWFVALAFDPSYTWESSGEPRNIASPEIFTEDFSAAVDYLWKSELVDREKIWIIWICWFGWFALSAASIDNRIKAVATSVMYDMSRLMSNWYNDINTDKDREALLEQYAKDRWNYVDGIQNNQILWGIMSQDEIDNLPNPILKMYMQYYRTARWFNKNSVNSNWNWNITNISSFFNFPLMSRIKYISPRPTLIIAWENAHSRYFSEDAYKNASEPKELYIVPWAIHTDLYDGWDKNYIPFEKLDTFFKTNLK